MRSPSLPKRRHEHLKASEARRRRSAPGKLSRLKNLAGFILLVALLFALAATTFTTAPAQAASSYYYQFINVDINILSNGDMEITETQKLVYTSGEFHHGYRWIPLDKVESIYSVKVSEGDEAYPQNGEVSTWINAWKKWRGLLR